MDEGEAMLLAMTDALTSVGLAEAQLEGLRAVITQPLDEPQAKAVAAFFDAVARLRHMQEVPHAG